MQEIISIPEHGVGERLIRFTLEFGEHRARERLIRVRPIGLRRVADDGYALHAHLLFRIRQAGSRHCSWKDVAALQKDSRGKYFRPESLSDLKRRP
jgi:hypothetical protein